MFCGAIESRAIRHLSVFTYTRTHKCNKEITQHQFFTGEAYFKHTRLSENVRLSFKQSTICQFQLQKEHNVFINIDWMSNTSLHK